MDHFEIRGRTHNSPLGTAVVTGSANFVELQASRDPEHDIVTGRSPIADSRDVIRASPILAILVARPTIAAAIRWPAHQSLGALDAINRDMNQTTKGAASRADIVRVVERLDPSVVDAIVRTGATIDEVVEALSEIESELAYDDFHAPATSTRVEQLRALLGPLFRERPSHIHRGRD